VGRCTDGVVGACLVDELDERLRRFRAGWNGSFLGIEEKFARPSRVNSSSGKRLGDDGWLGEFDPKAEVYQGVEEA
jgi:hypothetical protein